jgi:hypothetical protein
MKTKTPPREQIELAPVPLATLRPAEYNPRIMPPEERESLRKAIAEWGMLEPVLWNGHECAKCGDRKGVIIGGHTRADLAREAGEKDVSGVRLDLHLAEEKALNVALNKIGGEFDNAKLRALLREIQTLDAEAALDLTGFQPPEIENLLAPIEMPEPAAFAKVPEEDEPETGQMSFVLSRGQAARVLAAIMAAKEDLQTPNGLNEKETLGFALVKLAEAYAAQA